MGDETGLTVCARLMGATQHAISSLWYHGVNRGWVGSGFTEALGSPPSAALLVSRPHGSQML